MCSSDLIKNHKIFYNILFLYKSDWILNLPPIPIPISFFLSSLIPPYKSAFLPSIIVGDGEINGVRGGGGFIAQANRLFRQDLPSMNDYENHDNHAETVTKLQQFVVCRLGILYYYRA